MTEPVDKDLEYLTAESLPAIEATEGETAIGIADLFSGCGGLTLGAIEGARRAGRAAELHLAVDYEQEPLNVLKATLDVADETVARLDLADVLGEVGAKQSPLEGSSLKSATNASLLLAGPPCQGHSALNNHTRHNDDRNKLYRKVARAAELIEPKAVVIENVRGVGRDLRGAMASCRDDLEDLGYKIFEETLNLTKLGVAQRRFRHILVATREHELDFDPDDSAEVRSVSWAISDLLGATNETVFDSSSEPSPENKKRIAWLFAKPDRYDLPNSKRPKCHQDGDHSYRSMYGRMRWDEPAQTITTGFGSMGQGRFVHPKEQRTLTPHEAARLQFLPDFMSFDEVKKRGRLATMVGNAAPPALTIAIVQRLVEQELL